MSAADRFDHIAARARADTDSAVQKYHDQLRAINERLRISGENAGHRRGVTREALADHRGVLLPADDIDLSPHTPAPTAETPVTSSIVVPSPDPTDGSAADPDFSFSTGWLSDR